jgi:membrane-associated phospholipid phosphatase
VDAVVTFFGPVMTSDYRDSADRAAHAWLAIAVVSLAALGLLTVALMQHVVMPFDKPLLDLAVSWSGATVLWNVFSELGNYPMIPTGFGFVIWLLYKKRRREALLVVLLFAAATAGSEGIKALVARPRPTGPVPGIPGVVFSYPSGHAWEDVMILGMIALALWRRQRALWLRLGFVLLVAVFVTLVCVARAALNVHYPSDMLAGLLGGFGILGLYAWWTRPGARADKPPLWGR